MGRVYNDTSRLVVTGEMILAEGAVLLPQCDSNVAIENQEDLPPPILMTEFKSFPNPFNPSTLINFSIENQSKVNLTIYDMLGKKVTVLLDRYLPTGQYGENWNGKNDSGKIMPAGVYFARLDTGNRVESIKLTLIK